VSRVLKKRKMSCPYRDPNPVSLSPWRLLLTKLLNLRIFVGILEEKGLVGGRRRIWEDDIKMDLK
jgi:hypothetical protein